MWDRGVQDASDRPKLCGWANSWREQGGEGKGVAGEPGLAGSGGDNPCGWTLAPAPHCSVGALPAGGNAVWFPRLLLRLLALTLFPSVRSFIIYRFLLLFSSLAGSQCSWLWKGLSYGEHKDSSKYCHAAPLPALLVAGTGLCGTHSKLNS